MEFLAWPIVVLVLGILTLLIFKRELSNFLNRAEKISMKGIEASQPAKQLSESTQASGAASLLRTFDNALLLEREASIGKSFREENIDTSDRERVLLRFLAAAYIRLEFEETYRVIFGSQIGVLEVLNTVTGLDVSRLRDTYERAKEKAHDVYSEYSFESWFSFLIHRSLVALNNEGIAWIHG